ncbi:hypothetical protein V1505DRAFT_394259 [Lipomyces doorenjongii]
MLIGSAFLLATEKKIIIYSTYGHIAQTAEAEKAGIDKAGDSATIYQIPETLSAKVLQKKYAAPKPDYPIAMLWAKAALAGKYVGQFVSTVTPGGGQEVTVMNALSTYAFHGMILSRSDTPLPSRS